ncbi:hypothetical protein EXIGLDRAFT_731840 [Exidia glandulosa HHB12029]|uniref:Uncharacterized protein n=1 Tax=Exidia glandulosa HHB12029 TaxID=1314781 RepID=A0A165KWZ4_EXIGL|nr:hypothetical protein EXIGLDRAFT_731840 [Exidia glandulosa HHB12029]
MLRCWSIGDTDFVSRIVDERSGSRFLMCHVRRATWTFPRLARSCTRSRLLQILTQIAKPDSFLRGLRRGRDLSCARRGDRYTGSGWTSILLRMPIPACRRGNTGTSTVNPPPGRRDAKGSQDLSSYCKQS